MSPAEICPFMPVFSTMSAIADFSSGAYPKVETFFISSMSRLPFLSSFSSISATSSVTKVWVNAPVPRLMILTSKIASISRPTAIAAMP